MLYLFFCLLPILIIPISMYLTIKRDSLNWEIKKGKICYHCKSTLNLSDKDLMSRIMIDRDFTTLCLQCSRDNKINSIKNPILKYKYRFQKYLVQKKSDKITIYFAITSFFFITLDIILVAFSIKTRLSLVYGSINLIFWFINIYKILYTTKKKSHK